MKVKKRIIEIDIAKGILIFLVILGHSPLDRWLSSGIGSFHMAAFFCLSGFTYNYKGDFYSFCHKKTKSLISHYILFSVILIYLATIKHIFHVGLDNYSFWGGIESIFIPYSGRNTTHVYYLWFLPSLFFIETSLAFSQTLTDYFHNKLIGWGFIFFLSITCIMIHLHYKVASIISIYPIGLLFLLLGLYIKPFFTTIKKCSLAIGIFSFTLFVLVVNRNIQDYSCNIDLSSMCINHWWLFLLSGILGCFFTLSISTTFRSSIVQQIGRDSLYYYGLHYLVIWIVDTSFTGILCAIITTLFTFPLVYFYKKTYSNLQLFIIHRHN